MKRDGTDKQIIIDHLDSPAAIAVDWIAENLYWIDDRKNVIGVCRMDGRYRKIVVAGDLTTPSAIEISPAEGFLFWIDTDNTGPKLERAYLDGSDRKVIASDGNLEYVSDISIDTEEKWIYLSYSKSMEGVALSRISFDGNFNEVLRKRDPDVIRSPVSITFFDIRT